MSNRPFIAARLEEVFNKRVETVLRRFGWHESVITYNGYATQSHARVLARVVLVPRRSTTYIGKATEELMARRGWRNFFVAPCVRVHTVVGVGDATVETITDRGGYLDVRVPDHGLEPGWQEAVVSTVTASPQRAPIQVVDENEPLGLVSDIDDTVISTSLPRALIAAWNTFVLHESARQAVPGMADMYQHLLKERPGAPIVYVSTGAWNTAPMLTRFLRHHGFPAGTLLLTDWGPTNTGWFRSGQAHKRSCLRQLVHDFPHVRWVLVGDDGQHDPSLYGEFATMHPDRVQVIAIRQLTPTEQVLAHGTPEPITDEEQPAAPVVPEVRAPDGDQLAPLIEEHLPA